MRKQVLALLLVLIALPMIVYGVVVWQNNRSVPPPSRQEIAASWEKSVAWLVANRQAVLQTDNLILWWMIGESARLTSDSRLQALYRDCLAQEDRIDRQSIWRAFFEPVLYWDASYPQRGYARYLDYQQYLLFGMTCSKQLADEPLIVAQHNPGFCWRTHPLTPACATHQLMGFRLQQRNGCDRVGHLKEKIHVLQTTVERQLTWDPRVVDVYIQRLLMLVDSGVPARVKPRWLQRFLAAQLADGSWAKSRPLFSNVQGNLHTTAQGLWLLSLLQQEENYQALATH